MITNAHKTRCLEIKENLLMLIIKFEINLNIYKLNTDIFIS